MTEFLVGGRRIGKTTEMLRWMAGAGRYGTRVCMTFSEQESDRLRRLAEELELNIEGWRFISPYAAVQNLHGRGPVEVGVDNVEMVLAALTGKPVGFITATGHSR